MSRPGRALLLVVVVVVIAAAAFGHLLHSLGSGGSIGWCAFHGWRAYHNLVRHHPAWSIYQLWRSAHAC